MNIWWLIFELSDMVDDSRVINDDNCHSIVNIHLTANDNQYLIDIIDQDPIGLYSISLTFVVQNSCIAT